MVLDKGVRMKTIKGFENEDIIVSDFGEWVGKNYIDYKSEYKNNQKIIKRLLDENKQLKDNWNKLKKFLEEWKENEGLFFSEDGIEVEKDAYWLVNIKTDYAYSFKDIELLNRKVYELEKVEE